MANASVVSLGVSIHNEAQVAVERPVAAIPTTALMVTLKCKAVP